VTRAWTRFGDDTKASSVMEFGLVAPVMMLMLMGFYDLGHASYVRSVLQGAVQKAARDGTLQTGGAQATTIDTAVQTQVRPVAGKNATFSSSRLSYNRFSQVGEAEEFEDEDGDNTYDAGQECYEDWNGNGNWDATPGTAGQGGASDAVLYEVTVTYPRLFPTPKLLGWSANNVVKASTVLRNQPYGEQTNPSVTRCPPT
jgi:Flp pilus assembly protein TadG